MLLCARLCKRNWKLWNIKRKGECKSKLNHTCLGSYNQKETITSVDKNVEKSKPLCIASGNVNWYNCFAEQSGSSSQGFIYTHTHTHTHTRIRMVCMSIYTCAHHRRIIISSSALGYISKRIENICPHKNLYTNVHSSIIHNS